MAWNASWLFRARLVYDVECECVRASEEGAHQLNRNQEKNCCVRQDGTDSLKGMVCLHE